ncbi:hypothetical protein N7492_009358 [Penicillium capsulatum]|uniref:BTB domain-containing protein n=1 Tax=Penicillium capsulatum TaxID=69766 RepID=A0A9W9HUS1_9EURO|nr:hypothetical protein N7492_009358 [Penicillium capsulatum]
MNNGHTRESKHRIAVLEEEDVETFVAFCEYAYTGDYRVPRLPTPQPEHRTGVVEPAVSPAHSWRQSYRSESVSSAVPPPAPSPPPETVEATTPTTAAPVESDPTPVIEEDASAEAAAEEMDHQPKEDAEQKVADVSQEPQEATTPDQPVVDDENPAPINETDDWSSWGVAPNSKAKKTKKDSKKKKKKRESTEELPANLTPPSTPPPVDPEVEEIQPSQETFEEPAVEQVSPAPDASEQTEPSHEPPAEAAPEPEPVLEKEPEPEAETAADAGPEEWGESSMYPPEEAPENLPEEAPAEGSWDEGTGDDREGFQETVESPPKPFIDMSFANQPDSSPHTPGLSLWDEFAALDYNDEGAAPAAAPVDASADDLPYLTFHAKVYVFATRYLIPALAQLCLRKLHRDLLRLRFAHADGKDSSPDPQHLGGLAVRQAPMVLDLLRYAYTKTTRLEPISPTSATQLRENELRRLVVHYAACNVKELSRYHSSGDSGMATPSARRMDSQVDRAEDSAPTSLRVLLDMTPELASDLVYRMM